MSAEWTYHVSYEPPLIAVAIDPTEASHELITASREFGVNLWAEDQAPLASAAGNHSMQNVNKLPNAIFTTYVAKFIKAPMIEGCALNAECRLVAQHTLGDHTLFVGQVLGARYDAFKNPLLLRGATGYHQLGPKIGRPPFLYVFAGFRTSGASVQLNIEGRVTPAQYGDRLKISVTDPQGESVFSEQISVIERGFFHAALPAREALPKGEYLVQVSYGEHSASGLAKLT